jgi:hypothetical protein
MPPITNPVRISEPQKIETAQPQPQPAPRTKPFTIKVSSTVPT